MRRRRENRMSREEYMVAKADLEDQLARGYIDKGSFELELATLRRQAGR